MRVSSLKMFLKRLPWTRSEVDHAPHPVVGLVLQVRDAEKFPHAVGFEGLDHLFRVSQQGPCFTATEEDGGEKRLTQPKLALLEANGVAPPDPVEAGH